ncbi:MAG: FAD-binding oxidoreductase [Gammaproteobacteria bacterium]
MKHYVLALEVVLPTGDVVRTGARTRKSVTGYDLTSLLVGSEGTLGVVTEATLRLVPRPEAAGTLAAWFDDTAAAAAGVAAALDVPHVPCALEFVDARALSAVAAHRPDFRPHGAAGLVLIECDGAPEAVERELAAYDRALGASGAVRDERATDPAERDRLWEARRGISRSFTQCFDQPAVVRTHSSTKSTFGSATSACSSRQPMIKIST